MKNRAVFLDRDGVLCDAIVTNYKPLSARGLDDLNIPIPVMMACNELKKEGFKLLCVSNQPDIARGKITAETVQAQNTMIVHFCQLDDIETCPHDNDDHCSCRKPKPGMIYKLARKWDIDISTSYLVGDRWSDVEAGMQAGIPEENIFFIRRGYHEFQPQGYFEPVHFFEDAVRMILINEIELNA